MKKVVIVIPCYKESPSNSEMASLKQCYRILGKFPIFFVVPQGLNTSAYSHVFNDKINIKSFPAHFFSSIEEYSELLKTLKFYESFSEYEYMLIYQLDAWVFKDELLFWCKKGYDYIGAPWFESFASHEEGKSLWAVGNGGFSLRRVKKFMEITSPRKRVMTLKHIFKYERHKRGGILRCLLLAVGIRNNIKYYNNKYWGYPEDNYFCIVLRRCSNISLHLPKPEEALSFAFEKSPSFLFEKNVKTLPFGCHAWEKYEKDTFWNDKIEYFSC